MMTLLSWESRGAALFLSLCTLVRGAEEGFQMMASEDSVIINFDGERVTEFRSDRHVPYLYPLIAPHGGEVTRGYPVELGRPDEARDHPHHLSMWFAHGLVNGVDFWSAKENSRARIALKSLRLLRPPGDQERAEPAREAGFEAALSWQDGDRELLHEMRRYHFQIEGDRLTIDMTSTLTATERKVRFGDTKEGTFALRLTPTLRLKGEVAQGRILNSEGQKNHKVWGQRARWVAYAGPDRSGNPVVVTIMDHPENPRHPTWWHARDYGLFAANPFGKHHFERLPAHPHSGDLTLPKGESIKFFYRVVIDGNPLEKERIEEWFESFRKEG